MSKGDTFDGGGRFGGGGGTFLPIRMIWMVNTVILQLIPDIQLGFSARCSFLGE